MTSWAAHERTALVDALHEVGPDAPTLCEGWTAKDIAAHVYVREHRPDASLGVLPLGPLSAYTDRVMRSALRTHGFDGLLDALRDVPVMWRVTRLDEQVNAIEFFVHAEDVRRPNRLPQRDLPDEFERAIWRRLARQARLSFRRTPVRVRLVPTGLSPDAEQAAQPVEVGRSGGEVVEIHGRPSELLLFAFNRKADARLDLKGSAKAIDALQQAKLGL